MTSIRKLFERVRNNPKDVRFSDFIRLIEAFAFHLERHEGTSHRIYRHPTTRAKLNLQPDKHGKAKPYQVRQFLATVDENRLRMPEEDERP